MRESNNTNFTRTILRIFNISTFLISCTVAFLYIAHTKGIWNFSFNWLSVAYLISVATLLALLFIVRRKKNRNNVTFWFSIWIAFSAIFACSGAISASAGDLATYVFWLKLLSFSSVLLPPIFLAFALSYTEQEHLLFRTISWLMSFGAGAFFLALTLGSDVLYHTDAATPTAWGYSVLPPQGAYANLYSLWSTGLLVLGLTILSRFYLQSNKNTKRKLQARLVLLGAVIPIAFGTITVGLLPLFGLESLPTVPIVQLVESLVIGFAIVKYGLFSVDPATLSQTILSTMNESVITTSSALIIDHMNPNAEKLFDVSAEKMQGGTLSAVLGEEGAETVSSGLSADENTPIELEIVSHGTKVPLSMLSSKIVDPEGDTSGYIFIFRDITRERAVKSEIEHEVKVRTKELGEERARLEASINSLDAGFLMTDARGNIVTINAAAKSILSNAFPHDSDREWSLNEVQQAFGEGMDLRKLLDTSIEKWKVQNLSGVDFHGRILRIFAGPIPSKSEHKTEKVDVIGTVLLIEDITEEKVLERSKDEFFSIASHELRTPLTSIRGNSAMILQFYADLLKDKTLKEMLGDIHESSVRLIEIVNDFLDVSRIEQGKISYEVEKVALDKIVEEIFYEIGVAINEKGIYLKQDSHTLERSPALLGDKNRIKQIIYNLVGNAIKFTKEGGVTISAEKTDKDMVRVKVSDTGQGIPKDMQSLLFHKFQQAGHSILTRDSTRGTGLGLYISKLLAKGMGGDVQLASSEEGKGSVFELILPIATKARLERIEKRAQAKEKINVGTGMTEKPK